MNKMIFRDGTELSIDAYCLFGSEHLEFYSCGHHYIYMEEIERHPIANVLIRKPVFYKRIRIVGPPDVCNIEYIIDDSIDHVELFGKDGMRFGRK